MTRNNDAGAPADWSRFWDRAQQQAWDAWSRMARQSMSPPDPQPDALWKFWSEGLEQLWHSRDGRTSGTSATVSRHLLDQGRGFLLLSHQLLRALEQMQRETGNDADWKRVLREAIGHTQEQLRQCVAMSAGRSALWGLPMEMWERFGSALSPTADDWVQRGGEPARDGSGAGLGTEWRSRMQQGLQHAERYREAWQRYAAKLVDVGVLALDYLYERLVEAGDTGQRIDRLRTVYDLWVEAAEQAYAEVVGTPEFAVQQAELINTTVACKLQLQSSLEAAARAQDLPTRSELDSAHRAIKALRDELRTLRAELDDIVASRAPRRGGGKDKA